MRNRTSQEAADGVTFEEAREKEAQAIRAHPDLRGLPPRMLGIPALIRKLVVLQNEAVLRAFVPLRNEVRTSVEI